MTMFPDYRPCAGVAMVNRAGDVFVGRRKVQRDAVVMAGHEWQMPQGGIDEGETPLEAARRELYEETNVAAVSLLAEAPDWLLYDLPQESRGRFRGRYKGQAQKWFLFRFEGEDGQIDVARPGQGKHPAEFADWRWERWEALPGLVVPFKRAVYEQVVSLFAPIARGQTPA